MTLTAEVTPDFTNRCLACALAKGPQGTTYVPGRRLLVSAEKHSSASSLMASSSSSFQSLVASHASSNSKSTPKPSSSPSGIKLARRKVVRLWRCETGCTQRFSLSLLWRSRSSSIRLNISSLDNDFAGKLEEDGPPEGGRVLAIWLWASSLDMRSSAFWGSIIRLCFQVSKI
jgi:hypothetical protein